MFKSCLLSGLKKESWQLLGNEQMYEHSHGTQTCTKNKTYCTHTAVIYLDSTKRTFFPPHRHGSEPKIEEEIAGDKNKVEVKEMEQESVKEETEMIERIKSSSRPECD